MPKLSIIVPVYNVSSYLKNCIESLISQTYEDIEIILIDDGSKDNSGEICEEYAKQDGRIIFKHQNNSGVSVARNEGLNLANGEWITFVDGDDYVEKEFCKKILTAVETTLAEVIFFSYFTLKNNKKIFSQPFVLPEGDISKYKDYIQKKIITQYYDNKIINTSASAGTSWGKIIRKTVLDRYAIQYSQGLMRAQDTVFWLNVIEKTTKIFFLNLPLYYYRINDSSITSGNKFIPDSKEQFGKLLKEYQLFIKNNNKDKEYEKAFNIRTLTVLKWHMIHNFFHSQNPKSYNEKIRDLANLCNTDPYEMALETNCHKFLPIGSRIVIFLCKYHHFHSSYLVFKFLRIIKSIFKE